MADVMAGRGHQRTGLQILGILLVIATIYPLSFITHIFLRDATDVFSIATALAIASIGVPLAIVMFFMRLLHRSWADYGLRRTPAWRAVLLGVIVAVAIVALIKFGLIPIFKTIAPRPPDIAYLLPIRGNTPGLVFVLLMVWTTAAFGEEMLFRGFVLNEMAGLIGNSEAARWLAAMATGVLFGVGHLHQGLAGVLLASASGCLFGAAYLLLKRNLWPVIIAHGLIDTVSMTSIYLA